MRGVKYLAYNFSAKIATCPLYHERMRIFFHDAIFGYFALKTQKSGHALEPLLGNAQGFFV